MRYQHRDGSDAAAQITVPGVGTVPIEDGVFEADVDEETHERLVEVGHEPLDNDDTAAGDDIDEDDVDEEDTEAEADVDDVEPLLASSVTEDELVAMDRNELRAIAANYEDINGNWSGEKLTEELIKKRREEVDETEA